MSGLHPASTEAQMHAAEQVGSSLPGATQVCRMIAQVYVCACYSAVSFASLVDVQTPGAP